MSFNSAVNNSENIFENRDNRQYMEQTLSEDPLSGTSASDLANLQPRTSDRRESVSYTLPPEVKQGITQLAKKNGFKSTSQYVEAVFKQILGN